MTPADLSRLESLAREATPGPWFRPPPDDTAVSSMSSEIAQTIGEYSLEFERMEADAAYIAAANPAAVLALIARIAAQDELLAQCKATFEAMHPSAGLPDSDVSRLYNAMMEKLDG